MSQTFTTVSSATAARPGAAEEPLPHVGELQVAVLLGKDLAQPVRLLDGEAGQVDGHPGDVLLVDHDPEGLREGLLDEGVQGPVGGAVQALDEGLDVLVGRGADDGAGDDEVLVVPLLHLAEELARGRGFDVEHAEGLSPRDQVPGVGIRERVEALPLQAHAVVLVHQREGVAQHGEGPVAQQVDLHQARILRGVLLPGDDRVPQR